jgi:hypothetical protein
MKMPLEINYELASSVGRASETFANRTKDTIRYRALRAYYRDVYRGREPDREVVEEMERSNAEFLSLKAVRPGTVHVNQVLESLSVAYANEEFIGGILCPTVETGGKLSGVYYTYEKNDKLSYPDDTAADRTELAELNENRSTGTYSLTPRGFKEYVDQLTIQNQDTVLDELMDATENVLYALDFKEEQRAITLIEATGNYGGNYGAVAAGDRWNDGGGDPGAVVDAAKAACWTGNGPGRWVIQTSLDVYNVLKRHAGILDMLKYGGQAGSPKMASIQMLCEYFGVEQLLVGAARYNTANEGQTASYGRMWANGLSILRVSDSPSRRNASWAYTFQDGPTQSDQMWQLEKSVKGAWMCRSSRCTQKKVIAPLAGYRITTPIN